jgi:membrane protein implicated in regulation of membrane protease activity
MQLFEWPALAWLALAIVAAIVEVSLPHFGSMFISAAALVAAALAAFAAGTPLQILTFAFVLVACFVVLRPWMVARATGRGIPSRTELLIGKDGVVTHEIDPTTGGGRVNVGGEDWAARSTGSVTSVTIGTRVKVTGADGIVLEVTRT